MLTELVRAKLSTHSLMIAIGVLAFAGNHFFSDPRAAAWLEAHWALKDLGETLMATMVVYGVYRQPSKPAA